MGQLFRNKIYYRESLYEKRICLSISCLTHLQDEVLVKNDAFAKKHFAHLESISFIKNLEHESKFSENQFFYIGNLPVPSDLLPVTFKWDVRLYCTSQTAESFERATVFQNYSFKCGDKSGEITDSAGQQITVNEFENGVKNGVRLGICV